MLGRLSLVIFCICFISFSHAQFAEICSDLDVVSHTTVFNSTIREILFSSDDQREVYILTDLGYLYHSTDGGSSFTPQMEFMQYFFNTSHVGSLFGVASMRKGAQDGLVYFIGYGNVFWVSRGNQVYDTYYPPAGSSVLDIKPHPTNPNYVLRELITCTNQTTCFTSLEYNTQQGQNNVWTLVRNYVFSYSWGADPNQIYLISVLPEQMTGPYGVVPNTAKYFFVYQINGNTGSVANMQGPGIFSMIFREEVLYLHGMDIETHLSQFYMYSPDNGLVQIQFLYGETNRVDSNYFTVLDNSEGVSFISICANYSSIADLYQSPLDSGQFWLSLAYHRASCNSVHRNYLSSDFQKVSSLNATYIANSYDINAYELNGGLPLTLENYIQTSVTFDKGATWSHLPPVSSSCSDTPGCGLHLFSAIDSDTSAIIHSPPGATGLVLATGNEGVYRNPISDPNTATFLSRNGGLTWEAIKPGNNIFAVANYGSIFLLLERGNLTNRISYSFNQGVNWINCQFDTLQYHPRYIYVIPHSLPDKFSQFLVTGTSSEGSDSFVTFFDFNNIFMPTCQASDLESFTPSFNGNCLLGAEQTFTRKSRSSTCLKTDPDSVTVTGSCPCTRNDWTCDGDCFVETFDNQGQIICQNRCEGLPNNPQLPPVDCDETFSQTQGYRLVEGDICEGGVYLGPIDVPCTIPTPTPTATPTPTPTPASPPPDTEPTPTPTPTPAAPPPDGNPPPSETTPDSTPMGMIIGAIVLLLLLLLAVSIIVLIVLYKTNSRVRGLLQTYLPKSLGGGSSDDQLYSVFGDDGDTSLLDLNEDQKEDNHTPVTRNKTPLGPLKDLEDDEFDAALDLDL